jgi:hypothetical protein
MVPPSRQSSLSIINFRDSNYRNYDNFSSSEIAVAAIPSILRLNYSAFTVPVQQQIISSSFENLTSSNWVTVEGNGDLSNDQRDVAAVNASLSLNNIKSESHGYFAIANKFPISLSKFDEIELTLKVSKDINGEIKFILRDDIGSYSAWLIEDFPKDQWYKQKLSLSNPTLESKTKVDLSNVTEVDIGFQKLNINQTYDSLKIGEINGLVSEYCVPYNAIRSVLPANSTIILTRDPAFDASSLVELVNNGDHLFVFSQDNYQGGFFFNLLKLSQSINVASDGIKEPINIDFSQGTVPVVLFNSNVSCISYYRTGLNEIAPMVLFANVGKGSVTYVMLPSNILSKLQLTDNSLGAIFNQITKMQSFSIQNVSDSSVLTLGSYNTIEGQIKANGLIQMESEQVFQTDPIQVRKLSLTSQNFSLSAENITINNFEIYGTARVVADSKSLTMETNDRYTFLTAVSKDLNVPCVIQLSNNATANLSLTNSSGSYSYQIKEANITMDASQMHVNLYTPSIKVEGTIDFSSARIQFINPYVPIAGAVRQPLKITGETNLTVAFSSNGIALISNFSYDGSASLNTTQLQSTTVEIPWLGTLLSPAFFFVYLTILTLFVYYLNRRYERND